MKIIKDMIAAALVWADLSMIALTTGICLMAGLTCLSMWTSAISLWNLVAFPLSQWNEWAVVSGWLTLSVSNGALISAAWAWMYTCAAGFTGTVSVLAGHEAYCRLRVRLG